MQLHSSLLMPLLSQSILTTEDQNQTYLSATAVVTDATTNSSVFQCWRFLKPYSISSAAGTTGAAALQLGDISSIVYTVVPPRFDGGLHVAPATQLVVFLTGLAHVTLPDSQDEAWILGGTKNGVIVAADTVGNGHITKCPSDQETVALQIRFAAEKLPEHEVESEGPCH